MILIIEFGYAVIVLSIVAIIMLGLGQLIGYVGELMYKRKLKNENRDRVNSN